LGLAALVIGVTSQAIGLYATWGTIGRSPHRFPHRRLQSHEYNA